MSATSSNESYCTFTLSSDTTAGGLPSEEEIAKDLESNDFKVRCCVKSFSFRLASTIIYAYIFIVFINPMLCLLVVFTLPNR